jgi:hypothetical protein
VAETSDKRHFSRFPMQGNAQLACVAGNWGSRLLDISLKGVLITQPGAWSGSVGDHCRLQVMLDDSDVTITMDGVVAHVNGNVMGFRCDQIDLASISHLRRLIELNLGDERLLSRELGELIGHHG